ncbi:MAG: hypothetical protein QOH91_1492 [Mycobacterium sp.]|jgi:uncharacterized membrane protein ArfB|nr:hypothetical protein [Mycobacterium sp.]
MAFVIQWLWYLLAFAAGSAVTWVTVTLSIKHTRDGSTEAGAKR